MRRAILDGARRAFLAGGYAVSVDAIATEAGVARKTIFNCFGSKDRLFAAVLAEAVVHAVDTTMLQGNAELEVTLREFAEAYLRVALSKEMVALGRVVTAEYQRLPTLIGRIGSSFFGQMIPPLSGYFRRQMAAGRMVRVDPAMAAERFLSSIIGYERQRRALAVSARSAAQRRRYLAEAVRGFVLGVAPPRR